MIDSLVIEIANGKLEYKPHNESIVTLCSKSAIYLRAYPKTLPLLYVIHAQTKCNIAT